MDKQNEILNDFTKEEFLGKFIAIYLDLTSNKQTVEKPKSFLLGGQSGAGKSTLHQIIKSDFNNNVIIINGDDFRNYHPNSRELDEKYGKDSVSHKGEFSNKMVEKLVEVLSKEKYNLIVEGTLRTASVPLKTAKLLKSKGYTVELNVMAVKPYISYFSTLLRYEKMLAVTNSARATPKKHHDDIVNKLSDNIEILSDSEIFDNIKIYNRNKECLYNEKINSNNPSSIINQVLHGSWTCEEMEMLKAIWDSIESYMIKRDSNELNEFINMRDNSYNDINNESIQQWKNDIEIIKNTNDNHNSELTNKTHNHKYER